MASESQEYVPGTSSEAVDRATGKGWQEWFEALDSAGAVDMSHKEIVAWLRTEAGLESGWWQQNVSVEYEKARGKRAAVGETAYAGFQVGAQRTLPITADAAWEMLTASPGRDIWLGVVTDLRLEPGERYKTDDGTEGEIRIVVPRTRLRLTWQPQTWDRPSTLQLTFTGSKSAKGEKCTVGIHHERLSDIETRQEMKDRWRAVLAEIAERVQAE